MLSKTPESDSIPSAKIVAIGKTQTGKSALISRYINETFIEPVKTIGASFSTKVASGGKKPIKLKIWDTAGDERYRSLLPFYLRGSHAVLICFSVDDRHSFEQVESFMQIARNECQTDPYIMLVGTKCDREEDSDKYEKRQVAFDEADSFARGQGLRYIETSAKENRNVTETFELVGKEVLGRTDIEYPQETTKKSESSCSMF